MPAKATEPNVIQLRSELGICSGPSDGCEHGGGSRKLSNEWRVQNIIILLHACAAAVLFKCTYMLWSQ